VELDLYGGYKFEAAGLGFDVGYLRYQYVGNTLKNSTYTTYVNANTDEVYGAATYGVLTAKYSYTLSDLFGQHANGGSKHSSYFDLTANFDMGNGITLSPHIGRQVVQGPGTGLGGLSYTDGSLTVAKDLGNGLSATAAAIATTAKSSAFNSNYSNYATGKSAVVVGLKYGF